MAFQVVWTENALADYQQIVEYLMKEWPLNVARELVEIAESRIEVLSAFPFLGISSEKEKDIRSIVLTKHNKLYYKVSAERIEILNIFDTRQDPSRNKHNS